MHPQRRLSLACHRAPASRSASGISLVRLDRTLPRFLFILRDEEPRNPTIEGPARLVREAHGTWISFRTRLEIRL